MPLPTSIDDLSTTPGDNFPEGTDSPDVIDNVLREHAAYIAQLRDSQDPTLRTDLASTASGEGASLVALEDGRTVQEFADEFVSVRRFGVVGDGSDEATAFNIAAHLAAYGGFVLDLCGLTITTSGGFVRNTATDRIRWVNGGFRLTNGAKTSAAFYINGVDSVVMDAITLDGNRFNVTGNNAGFFVVMNTRYVKFNDITIHDLRRYAINCTPNCDTVEVSNVRGIDIGIAGTALGEAIKIEHSRNVKVNGFYCTNPSGTGGGQVAKVFHCENVDLKNFDIESADPALVYPAISMVRNDNLTYENVRVSGDCQVALEDNANVNVTYRNIETSGTRKALIMGTDGASEGDRYADNISVDNWVDSSTDPLAFNIIGVRQLRLRNVSTAQTINISRDSPTDDRRTTNLDLENVSCGVLNTLLVNGVKNFRNVNVSGLWTNTSGGVSNWMNSSYGSYTNLAQADVFLARWRFEDQAINLSGTLTGSGGTLTYLAPSTIANDPFAGEVFASSIFTSSGATQWSQIRWSFYDWGTPTVLKTVLHSGSTPRTNINLSVARGTRLLTFTNSDSSNLRLDANVQFVNRNSSVV